MPRLDRLTEHLFTHPGSTLCLDSDSPGFYLAPSGEKSPVFKQSLRAGQIVQLLADTVPRHLAQDFLAGRPIKFILETPRGALTAQLEMKGRDFRARVTLTAEGEELVSSGLGLPREPIAAAPPRTTLMSVIAQLVEKRATHLHLAEDRPAFVRIDGRLLCLEELGPINARDLRELLLALAPEEMREVPPKYQRFQFSSVSKDSVFHVRGHRGNEGVSVLVRALPRQVPTLASLGVPDEFAQALRGSGLWVVVGGRGQGTSTTVAALVQSALAARTLEVCTLESPIDYLLQPKRGLVQQLEIGLHAPSFVAGLEDARRSDADLVVVGQLDEPEVLSAAMGLADRGPLVLGVLHANSALAGVQKLLELMPSGSSALASQLRGVFAQRLVRNRAGGRSLCWELLPGIDEVKALVKDRAIDKLKPLLTRTADQSLLQFVLRGEVDAEVALSNASDRVWLGAQLAVAAHPRAA